MTERQWELSSEIAIVKRLKRRTTDKQVRRAYDRLHYILYSWYVAEDKKAGGEMTL